jgi:hypothetical protein
MLFPLWVILVKNWWGYSVVRVIFFVFGNGLSCGTICRLGTFKCGVKGCE